MMGVYRRGSGGRARMMSAAAYKDVGTVRAIGLYPVKSMQGQFVDSAKLGFGGLAHDRDAAPQVRRDADRIDDGLPRGGRFPS